MVAIVRKRRSLVVVGVQVALSLRSQWSLRNGLLLLLLLLTGACSLLDLVNQVLIVVQVLVDLVQVSHVAHAAVLRRCCLLLLLKIRLAVQRKRGIARLG